MAFVFQKRYEPRVEEQMRAFELTLSEKDRRRFAALEAMRLGHGGIEYVAAVLGCSTRTIERGIEELDQLPDDPDACGERAAGEKKVASEPQLEQNLKSVLEVRTAGDPDEPGVLWTDLSPRRIADAVSDLGTPVSAPVVQKWMQEQKLALHKMEKVLQGGRSPDRDAQFQRIAELKAQYVAAGNPVLSLDTKAKEHLGRLFGAGRLWTQKALKAFDHDFPSWATGVVIPHGIYDIARNRGHINIGLSHDTGQFACDSFRWYWNRIGRQCYPDATSILLLADCGGSNSPTHHIFKEDLQHLANDLEIEIRMARYPSYCSKYNPIEHRLFPHVTRACQGMLFDTAPQSPDKAAAKPPSPAGKQFGPLASLLHPTTFGR